MALLTFTYVPSRGFKRSSKPRVTSITFGDGYAQRTSRGINPLEETFNLTFVNSPNATATLITDFFALHAGYKPFKWTPTGYSSEILVVCTDWDATTDNHLTKTISANFSRVYDPSV